VSSLVILNIIYIQKSKNFYKNFKLLFFYLIFLCFYIFYIIIFLEHNSYLVTLILILTANIIISILYLNHNRIKTSKVFVSHYGPILIIISLFISAKYELEFLKLLLPSDNVILENQLVVLRNIFFSEKNNYNINFSNFLIKSNIFNNNLGVIFSEKRFFFLTNTYTSKGNIYSNILGDIQIFLSSGNLFDG
jgi:cytochrome c biogenesis factor